MIISKLLKLSIQAALISGKAIMKVYQNHHLKYELKNDESPLTEADKISHDIITGLLSPTELPILSEEGSKIDYNIRKNWNSFWLIDPIDGTKEFLKKNDEFTVNIALIENGRPVLGVVYAPALKVLYFAEENFGSFKIQNITSFNEFDSSVKINLLKSIFPETYTLVVSKSHMNIETQRFVNEKLKKYGKIETSSFGSSLKICKIAEGSAHCYPRLGPTMEWDTAAAHAIAIFANKNVTTMGENKSLVYNKENLFNPYFIVERL